MRALRACAIAVGIFSLVTLAMADQPARVPHYPDVTLMVLVPERVAGTYSSQMATAETELMRHFLAAGYKVVDQAQAAAARDWTMADAILRDRAGAEARSLAAKYGANLLVIGHARAQSAGRTHGLATARGTIEVRVLVPTTGEVLFADSVTESGADVSVELAARKALDEAAARLSTPLIAAVGQATNGPVQDLASTVVPDYSSEGHPQRRGPIRVAVTPFTDRSGWHGASWDLRKAVPELIAKELMKLPGIEVVDRTSLDETLGEQALGLSGLTDRRGSGPHEVGTLMGADVLIVGTISEFATKKSTYGGILPWKAGAAVHREKGIVKILLKVIDARTGQILGMGEATGDATEVGISGGYLGIIFGGAQFDKTAMGRATREAVRKAVALISGVLACDGAPTRVCPHCGATVSAEARYCPQCGKKLPPVTEVPRCPKCDAPLPPGAKYCPHCGAKIER